MAAKKRTVRGGGPNDKRLHRRQLFHWFGEHIDRNKSKSVDERTADYIECIVNSIERGLWLNKPRDRDFLGRKQEFEITQPICCFTETSVLDVADHAKKYGSLGLGFPKKFVLRNGGMPVHYASESASHPVFKSWKRMQQLLSDRRLIDALDKTVASELTVEFKYMTHFLKRMEQPPRPNRKQRPAAPGKKLTRIATKKAKPVSRSFGPTLPLLEEREWRIVVKENGKTGNTVKNEMEETPSYYLPYEVGKDLFTIVVPDNRTHLALLNHKKLRRILFQRSDIPVTVLSLTDIGTF